jgi:short-subunit dehydrogenase
LRHGHFGGNAPIFHNIHELGGDDVRLPDFADLSPASLRRELMIYGIDVIVIVPGSVVTAIWDKGEAEDLSMYQGTDYAGTVERFRRFMVTEGRNGLSPDRLGQTVYTALTARHPKTSYTAIPQRLKNWSLPLSLPKRLVDKMIAKQLNLTLVRANTRP